MFGLGVIMPISQSLQEVNDEVLVFPREESTNDSYTVSNPMESYYSGSHALYQDLFV